MRKRGGRGRKEERETREQESERENKEPLIVSFPEKSDRVNQYQFPVVYILRIIKQ